ncbi:UNKNOWN [Stylonychia lemnae]|uniref:Transmembrane protein n=1 Tax=Stylonychia lemnae TaxID=5949 RepID=A0A077ZZ69_STYLE|nr:UNKNOWN [Stylonychia lemnae]|eukprot:CDW75225.1 UNKNOWN [Stylonychia lemnae]
MNDNDEQLEIGQEYNELSRVDEGELLDSDRGSRGLRLNMDQINEYNNELFILPGQILSPKTYEQSIFQKTNTNHQLNLTQYQSAHSRMNSTTSQQQLLNNKFTYNNIDLLDNTSSKINEDDRSDQFVFDDYQMQEHRSIDISYFDDLVTDSKRKMFNPSNKPGLIELSEISFVRSKKKGRSAITHAGTAISTDNQDEDQSTSNKNSSIFKSITLNTSSHRETLETSYSMRNTPSKRPYFKCIHGIFLRYFIFASLSLKYCLWLIIAIDATIGLVEVIGIISSASTQAQTAPYIIKHLLKLLLFIPTIIFEVLVIRHYKLIHSKVLYGLKLASSACFQIIHIVFYILNYCPSTESDGIQEINQKNTHESSKDYDCVTGYTVFVILSRIYYDFVACWVALSIVHWVRRNKLDIILGIQRPKQNLFRRDTSGEYDHEKQKLYNKDQLAIPTKGDLERQKKITKTVDHINKYSMGKSKSQKNNFRRMYSLQTQ